MNNLDLLRLYFATRLQSRDIRKFKGQSAKNMITFSLLLVPYTLLRLINKHAVC